jgi:diguanylate cyclase (GGDEF)-like protein
MPDAKRSDDQQVDALTGLLGPEALNRAIAGCLDAAARKENVSLAYVAFDGLRDIYGGAGNLVGDTLMRELGRRLAAALRPVDRAGRIARDEFVIVFGPFANKLESLAVIARVRAHLAEPIKTSGSPFRPIVNIGTGTPPNDGATAEALVSHAEEAMLVVREQMREAAKKEAVERVAKARAHVEFATKNVADAEQLVRDADNNLVEAKRMVVEAKAAVTAALENAKALGVTIPGDKVVSK